MSYEGVPGLVETREAHGETTLVVDSARLIEACSHLRDAGFNVLSDITRRTTSAGARRASRATSEPPEDAT